MQISASDGASVAFEEFGAKNALETGRLPVVLLHGLTQQRNYWAPVIRRLTDVGGIAVDQRGHGEASGTEVRTDSDFSMERLARDIVEVLDAADMPHAIVVGHSWGASVALHAAARHQGRIRAAVLIDGGLFGPRHLVGPAGGHDDVREALRPPPLGMLEPALWQAIGQGDLAPYWSDEVRAALAPTFRVDDTGHVFSRLGMDRHMAVLDGLFDYDPAADAADVACPVWAVVCEERSVEADGVDRDSPESPDFPDLETAWRRARAAAVESLSPAFFLQRWYGALHDVPLQWPALVAGLIETVVERTSDPQEAR